MIPTLLSSMAPTAFSGLLFPDHHVHDQEHGSFHLDSVPIVHGWLLPTVHLDFKLGHSLWPVVS